MVEMLAVLLLLFAVVMFADHLIEKTKTKTKTKTKRK